MFYHHTVCFSLWFFCCIWQPCRLKAIERSYKHNVTEKYTVWELHNSKHSCCASVFTTAFHCSYQQIFFFTVMIQIYRGPGNNDFNFMQSNFFPLEYRAVIKVQDTPRDTVDSLEVVQRRGARCTSTRGWGLLGLLVSLMTEGQVPLQSDPERRSCSVQRSPIFSLCAFY